MKNFIQVGLIAAGAALVLAAGTVNVIAQGSGQESKLAEIKARQDFMKAQGADVKKIIEYIKGQGSQAEALAAANDLESRAPKIIMLFPPGTSAADFPGKTAAKPAIWQNMDKVRKIPVALEAAEIKLVAAIKSGERKSVQGALGAVSKDGCGACHSVYRMKRP